MEMELIIAADLSALPTLYKRQVMVLHKSRGIEDQEPSLLCLNQLQENVITVKDVPMILPDGYVQKPHSIYILE